MYILHPFKFWIYFRYISMVTLKMLIVITNF